MGNIGITIKILARWNRMLVSKVTFWESSTCMSVAVSMSRIQMRIMLSLRRDELWEGDVAEVYILALKCLWSIPIPLWKFSSQCLLVTPTTRQKDWQNLRIPWPLAKVQFYVYGAFCHLWYSSSDPTTVLYCLAQFKLSFQLNDLYQEERKLCFLISGQINVKSVTGHQKPWVPMLHSSPSPAPPQNSPYFLASG